jgi:ATP-dependent Lhr-like helicase
VSEFEQLHPSLQYHVVNTLGWSTLRPTQLAAIAPIHAGTHCLLLAPTAGGKTEAAAIPDPVEDARRGLARDERSLHLPDQGAAEQPGAQALALRRPGGTPRRGLARGHLAVAQEPSAQGCAGHPSHDARIVEAMLISARVDRPAWFGNLQAVIVDELHAFAGDDRGWHLRSVLHRLDQYLERPLQRIGLSATVSNPSELLAWLAPIGAREASSAAPASARTPT